MRFLRTFVLGLSVLACTRAAPPPATSPPPDTLAPKGPPPWFENDYQGALAKARAEKVPLFVDASAVWCHTCLAMRAYVLDDQALDRSGFVWLSFDVEKPENGALAARYPVSHGWEPTPVASGADRKRPLASWPLVSGGSWS